MSPSRTGETGLNEPSRAGETVLNKLGKTVKQRMTEQEERARARKIILRGTFLTGSGHRRIVEGGG